MAAGAAVLALGLTSCGGGSSSPVVAHVGHATIDEAAVAHWTRVIQRGGGGESALADTQGTPRQRALEFLISSQWLLGEAAEEGIALPARLVEQRLDEQRESTPEGARAFQESLDATDQTTSDVQLEAKL